VVLWHFQYPRPAVHYDHPLWGGTRGRFLDVHPESEQCGFNCRPIPSL